MGFSKIVKGRLDTRVEVDVFGSGIFVESFGNQDEPGIAVLTPRQARRLARKLRRAARYYEGAGL